MADTFTLTGDLANMIGGDFAVRTLSARIESNAAGGVIAEPDAGKVHLGGLKLDVQPDGTFTPVAGLLAEGDLQYQVTVSYVDPGSGRPKTEGLGWWPHPLADTTVDLSTRVTTTTAPPAYDIPAALAATLAARDEAVATVATIGRDQPNGVAPLDGAGKLPEGNVPPRLEEATLSATYASKPDNGNRAVGKDELVLNVSDYGLNGDGNPEDLTALAAAIGTGGCTVYWPKPSVRYNLVQPLPAVSNVTYRADGLDTLLRWTVGSMLVPTSTLSGVRFENISIDNWPGASHLIDATHASAGLIFCTFDRAEMRVRATATSIIKYAGNNLFANTFDDCKLWRMPNHTVSAFDIIASNAGVNTNRWRGGWWHSQECASTPFLRAEATAAGGYISKFTFEDVIGEQNYGGLVHIFSANAPKVSNFVDHDALTSYADDLFKFAHSTGPSSRGVTFDNSGTAGGATFAAGKGHLNLTGGSSHRIGRILNGGNVGILTGVNFGRTVQHGGADARSVATTTANYTIGLSDWLVIFATISNRTATLPDPTALLSSGTLPAGREYVVKNVGTGTTTVVSAGTATIDGVADRALTQWQSARFITDGTNWITA